MNKPTLTQLDGLRMRSLEAENNREYSLPVSTAGIRQLIAEIKLLRKDEARLDWLIEHVEQAWADNDIEELDIPNRAVIDAAMASEQ